MIAQRMREQYTELKKRKSTQNSVILTPRTPQMRQSFHVNSTSKSKIIQYEDYLITRQPSSNCIELCCNCINENNILQKKQQAYLKKQEDQQFIEKLNKQLVRQQSAEQQRNLQLKQKEKQMLKQSYNEHQIIQNLKKQVEQKETQEQIKNILEKDKLDKQQIKLEIQQQIEKKKQFMKGLEQQLNYRLQNNKTTTEITNNWFQIGDEERSKQIQEQKKQFERNILKQQRDEQIKLKQQKILEYEQYQKKLEKQIAIEAAKYDMTIQKEQQIKIHNQKFEYCQYLDQVIKQQQEQKKTEKLQNNYLEKKTLIQVNQENNYKMKTEQTQELTKKKLYIEGLQQQINNQRILKTEEKQIEKLEDQIIQQQNQKFEYLRKSKQEIKESKCCKCTKQYNQKLLTKIVNL